MKHMTLTASVMHFPTARLEGILLQPTGLAQTAGYVWRRVFLKGVHKTRELNRSGGHLPAVPPN